MVGEGGKKEAKEEISDRVGRWVDGWAGGWVGCKNINYEAPNEGPHRCGSEGRERAKERAKRSLTSQKSVSSRTEFCRCDQNIFGWITSGRWMLAIVRRSFYVSFPQNLSPTQHPILAVVPRRCRVL